MKSIKKFENQKVSNTFQSQTKGGLTSQTNEASDLRIGKTLYTNLLDGTVKNNDKVKF